MTAPAIKALVEDGNRQLIAAYRYLAFLDIERQRLTRELFPEATPGRDLVIVPADRQVLELGAPGPDGEGSTPLDRARTVLEALGIDPFAPDVWTKTLDGLPTWWRGGDLPGDGRGRSEGAS